MSRKNTKHMKNNFRKTPQHFSSTAQNYTKRKCLKQCCVERNERRESGRVSQTRYNKIKTLNKNINQSKSSLSNHGNHSLEMLERKHERISNLKPIRNKEKNNEIIRKSIEGEQYNNLYYRGIYSEKSDANSNINCTSSLENPYLKCKMGNLTKKKGENEGECYGNLPHFSKRYQLFFFLSVFFLRSKSNNTIKIYTIK